ncbi:hypothetical protein HNS38_20040 [Lentimicrobium sp. L6]|nr:MULTISPECIES: hypothetical protein [unclassified Lentimicrobium]NPD48318.1 hypothetical protein [Lentimicrobium sp. S6]NPD87047.1 hypothetical protein [Lentimicrobium sp. L6]
MSLFFPEGMLDYFDITDFTKTSERIDFYLSEKNIIPIEYKDKKLTSKGFYDEKIVEDFPLRGLEVRLHVKRRRWIVSESQKIVNRNWELVAKGTRKTKEFATFLKEYFR